MRWKARARLIRRILQNPRRLFACATKILAVALMAGALTISGRVGYRLYQEWQEADYLAARDEFFEDEVTLRLYSDFVSISQMHGSYLLTLYSSFRLESTARQEVRRLFMDWKQYIDEVRLISEEIEQKIREAEEGKGFKVDYRKVKAAVDLAYEKMMPLCDYLEVRCPRGMLPHAAPPVRPKPAKPRWDA